MASRPFGFRPSDFLRSSDFGFQSSPLLSSRPPSAPPRQNRPGAKIKSVYLDPGHGGKDPGNHVGSKDEKTYTLLLAQEVRQQLTRAGLKATLTRSSDTFIELPDRPA